MPSPYGGDDLVGFLGSSEWLRVLVDLFDEAVDGGLKSDDGVEHAALEPAVGQSGKELLAGDIRVSRAARLAVF